MKGCDLRVAAGGAPGGHRGAVTPGEAGRRAEREGTPA